MAAVDDQTAWARWLQAQLDARGWSRGDLLDRSPGITKDRLSKWLRGEEVPRIGGIRAVCMALGVPAVEGMVAAGHLEPDDVGATITERVDVSGLSNRELLAEVARRMSVDVGAMDEVAPFRRKFAHVAEPHGVEGSDWAALRRAKNDDPS